jgi:hypothetical protein
MENTEDTHTRPTRQTFSGGVNFNGAAEVSNSNVAGGDITTTHNTTNHTRVDNRRRNVRIGIGSLVLLVLLGGGYLAIHAATQDVVYQRGVAGATATADQLKQAEIDQDADRWCFLASSTSGSPCRSLMANSFTVPASKRSQISQVQLGAATGNDSTAQVPVLANGKTVGQLMMSWTGTRWQLNSAEYPLAINDGGILMAIVEDLNHCGSIAGIPTGC